MKHTLQILSALMLSLILSAGCSSDAENKAVKDVYEKYTAAIKAGNLEEMKKYMQKDKLKELSGPQAPMMLEMLKAMMPTQCVVTSISFSNNVSMLILDGMSDGHKATGDFTMVKEEGQWKISKVGWTISMDLSGDIEAACVEMQGLPVIQTTLEGHQGEVTELLFTRDSRFLVSVSYGDYSIRVWDAETGAQISTERMENRPRQAVFRPKTASLLVGDVYENVTEREIDYEGKLSPAKTFLRDAGDVIAISPDGSLLAAATWQKSINIYNATNGQLITSLKESEKTRKMEFTPKGDLLIAGGNDNKYRTWDTKKWGCKVYPVDKISETADTGGLSLSRDGKTLALGYYDSSIVLVDFTDKKEIRNWFVPDASTIDTALSPGGSFLVTANKDIAYVWNAKTGKGMGQLSGHKDNVTSLAFSPDGRCLATGSGAGDRRILIWRESGAAAVSGQPPVSAPQPPKPAQPKMVAGPVLLVQNFLNPVQNPSANDSLKGWQKYGEAGVEADPASGNPCFTLKYGGSVAQRAVLPPNSGGKYALVIARAMSERVKKDKDDDQTGIPYLSGDWVNAADDHKVDGYLSAETMRFAGTVSNQWGIIYGIFEIPKTSGKAAIVLGQADGKTAQNGSAARIDDVWLFVVDREEIAQRMVETYRQNAAAIAAQKVAQPLPAAAPAPKPSVNKDESTAVYDESFVGKKMEEVIQIMGSPRMKLKQGKKIRYVYDTREVVSSDGVTVELDLKK